MERIKGIRVPRRLSYRVWLLTLPSALISFERRQKVPKLPIGRWRFAGAAVVAAGLGLIVWGTRGEGVQIPYSGPGSQLTQKPGAAGGIVVLAGIALLLRSAVLAGYSAALLLASGTDALTLEEPDIDDIVPHQSLTR
jgi:hypothetical protein